MQPKTFHLAYKEAYPSDTKHHEFLQQAYFMQSMMLMEQKMSIQKEDELDNPNYLAKRFGSFSSELLEFLKSRPKKGTIWKNQPKIPYISSIRPMFSNVRDIECAFHYGKNFVMVGCVDAQMLLQTTFKYYENCSGPIHVHFIERDKYAVAKTMIIMRMCQMQVPEKNIIQAWYSSTWSKATLEAFFAAIDDALKNEVEPQVAAILKHWRGAPTRTSKHAYQQWLELQTPAAGSFSTAASLVEEKDQVAYCRYTLTGELKMDLEQAFANVTMFSNPDNAPPFRKEPNITEIVPMETEMQKSPAKVGIMTIVTNFLTQNVKKIIDLFKQNLLVFHFKVAEVTIANTPMIEYIKKQNPWVICWSNLLDFMPRLEFHAMAKACSTPDTLHAVHSSNWETQTFGTEISDYPPSYRAELLKQSTNAVCMPFHKLMPRVRKYVMSPPYTHFRNISSFLLGTGLRKEWMAYFFQGLVPLERVNDMSAGFFSVFISQPTTLHLNYSYNYSDWNIKGSPLHDEDDPVLAQQMAKAQAKLQCASCKLFQGNTESFKRCSQCKSVYYCNVACQTKHWPEHKKTCSKK